MSEYEERLLHSAQEQDRLSLEQCFMLEMCRLLSAILYELKRSRR